MAIHKHRELFLIILMVTVGILVMIYQNIQESLYRNNLAITCYTVYVATTINDNVMLNLRDESANQRIRERTRAKDPSKELSKEPGE